MDKPTELLAHYATSLRFEHLPAEVVHDTKRKLIDTLGCAIGAYDEEPCRFCASFGTSTKPATYARSSSCCT